MPDIIERLNHEEMFVDAIDDAVAEIERLRETIRVTNASLQKLVDAWAAACPDTYYRFALEDQVED